LRQAASPLVLVLPVDLPCISTGFLRKLLRRCDPITGAIATLNGELEPLVAVYPRRCHTYATFRIANSQLSVRSFAQACLHERALRTLPVQPADVPCFTNCNTPADLAALDP
jgi:molybdopterin-guanine dinucleotide biosynthesis protein A